MSFSELAVREMIEDAPSRACCRRALALGMILDAQSDADGIGIDIQSPERAEYYAATVARQLSAEATTSIVKKAGREFFRISTPSHKYAEKLRGLDGEGSTLSELIEFKCPSCRMNFLRGIFIVRGSFTFSAGNNHLELRIKHPRRADLLCELLSACGVEPKRVERRGAVGLYYKKSDKIEDFFNLLQMKRTLFEIMNTRIERDFIMDTNRAVNCESSNIMKSVDSSQRQIRALELLRDTGALEGLPQELAQTAKLRLENHSASLSELAELHDPKINKSAVSRRISRLVEMADKLAAEKKNTPDQH